jgi:hypothetical protein
MAASEGVGMAYDLQTVSCVTYSGSTLEAVTLTTRKGPFRVEGVSPSPAYMGIIIQGARQGFFLYSFFPIRFQFIASLSRVMFS